MGVGTGKKLITLGKWWLEEREDSMGKINGSFVMHTNCSAETFFSVMEDGKCWGCSKKIPKEIVALWILHNNSRKRGEVQ